MADALKQSSMSRVLIVGGSFAGVAALKALIKKSASSTKPLEVTLVEPKLGMLNILGIPKAVIDPDFAVESFVSFDRANVYWDTIRLQEGSTFDAKKVLRSENGDKPNVGIFAEEVKYNPNLKLHFIQGQITQLSKNSAHVKLEQLDKGKLPDKYKPKTKAEEFDVSFDSCIICSGRTRNWPLDPLSSTSEELRKEMTDSAEQIKNSKKTVIIGGGALGIELAGEIKHEYPEKEVVLIHPHSTLPPESLLGDQFKEQTLEFLKNLGIEVLLNTRVKTEAEDGTLVTTDGRTISSDLVFWCNYKKNNVSFLAKNFPTVFAANGDVEVTKYYELKTADGNVIENIFAVGDLANLALVKTAGWAFRQGMQAANNALELLSTGSKENYESVNEEFLNKAGMVLVVGMNQSICEDFQGSVFVNDPEHLEMYTDYRLRIDLDLLAPVVYEPLELAFRQLIVIELVPVLFSDLCCKELVKQVVAATVNHQSAISGAMVAQADDTLNTVEPRLERRLVKVRPWLHFWSISSVWKSHVQRVERGQQLICAPELFELAKNSRLHSGVPHKLFVGDSVAVVCVDVSINRRQVLFSPSFRVIKVEFIVSEALHPLESFLLSEADWASMISFGTDLVFFTTMPGESLYVLTDFVLIGSSVRVEFVTVVVILYGVGYLRSPILYMRSGN
ncbi:hypothetical protein OGAPHI_003163 [Ogataea philodendri]|uniref:FAD/NAD(P)-binding domain-containing protein n=1 Tax=Ogataea philodendri TaxID=1378263 RepID=A0A9P8PA60_9ASCO|nr:uncharacterized protein OGAPHI_003163 [Ogataea philodendri]KAH3667514.1 hypothetical protein OGAPHI_003163 [Ogataea philodendri]